MAKKRARVVVSFGSGGMRRRVRPPTLAERIKAAQAGLPTRAARAVAREAVIKAVSREALASAKRRAAVRGPVGAPAAAADRRAAEECRRAAYLRELADRRLAAAGATGKRAKRTQAAIYKALGLDIRAGFEGRPPAFEVEEINKLARGGVQLIGVRNCARDPIHRLRTMGDVTERQHKALLAMLDLLEEHQAAGLKGAGLNEAVDGGRLPDISIYLLDIARRMRAFESALTDEERHLLVAIAIDGLSLSCIAALGFAGRSRTTVRARLRLAMERAAEFFGVAN